MTKTCTQGFAEGAMEDAKKHAWVEARLKAIAEHGSEAEATAAIAELGTVVAAQFAQFTGTNEAAERAIQEQVQRLLAAGWQESGAARTARSLLEEEYERQSLNPAASIEPTTPKQDADSVKKYHPIRDAFLRRYLVTQTRNGIAEGAGFSPSSLQRWHEGSSRLHPDNVDKLAKQLKVKAGTIPNL